MFSKKVIILNYFVCVVALEALVASKIWTMKTGSSAGMKNRYVLINMLETKIYTQIANFEIFIL